MAGGIPRQDEPLYEYTRGKPKALLDIAGKPMVQWVLDALSETNRVDDVVLIGLTEDSGVNCKKPLTFIPNQGGMIENIIGGIHKVMEIHPQAGRVLLASSDIPGISAAMVDWEIETALASDVDLCYTVVKREVVEARYPHSHRTYLRLKGLEVCGGDLNVIHTSVVRMNPEIWEKLIASRKNPLKQAAILGIDTLVLMLLRVITLDVAVERLASRLHMTGRAILCPYAEVGMDVDKPNQLEMMRADLARRAVP